MYAVDVCIRSAALHPQRLAGVLCIAAADWSTDGHRRRPSRHLWLPGRAQGQRDVDHVCGARHQSTGSVRQQAGDADYFRICFNL